MVINPELFPEHKNKTPVDLLRDQLFFIMMISKTETWNSLLSLPDFERDELYVKCAEHAERLEEEYRKIEAQSRRIRHR